MSKLEELIKEFCPNGVEYKNFYSVCKYVRGITYSSVQELFNTIDGTPVLRANNIDLQTNTLILEDIKFVDESVKIKEEQWLKKDDILICAGSGSKEHIGKIAYIFKNVNMTFGGFMGVIRANRDLLLSRFLFHFLTSNMFKRHLSKVSASNSSTINNINNETWRNLQIPLPALPVQREIVRVLDSFTLYSAELTAELTARRKQYEFYRDKLLDFGNAKLVVKNKKLKELCISIKDGMHNLPVTTDENTGYPVLSAMNIYDGQIHYDAKRFVSREVFEQESKRTKIETGDVLLTIVATIGRTAVVENSTSFLLQRSVCALKPSKEILSKYLKYYLDTNAIQNYIFANAHGSAQAGLYLNQVADIEVVLPPMEVQERIVRVLDNFDAICFDLGIGLPAEIEKRQKQYEYYREKLLTFDGKYATILTERNGTGRAD